MPSPSTASSTTTTTTATTTPTTTNNYSKYKDRPTTSTTTKTPTILWAKIQALEPFWFQILWERRRSTWPAARGLEQWASASERTNLSRSRRSVPTQPSSQMMQPRRSAIQRKTLRQPQSPKGPAVRLMQSQPAGRQRRTPAVRLLQPQGLLAKNSLWHRRRHRDELSPTYRTRWLRWSRRAARASHC